MNTNPTLRQFKKLARKYNLIVFSRKFYADWLTPLSMYQALRERIDGENFLLESVDGQERICRFSFIGCKPIVVFKSKGRVVTIEQDGKKQVFETQTNPLEELRRLMNEFKPAPMENLRFFGGFVGYSGYDLARFFEPVGDSREDPLNLPDTYYILPKYLIIFDHIKHQAEILAFAPVKNNLKLELLYHQEINAMEKIFAIISGLTRLPDLKFSQVSVTVKSNYRKSEFCKAVEKAKNHIRNGDVIQVVLSQRFSVDFTGDSFTAYRYMRALNPSPYMFYLNFKEVILAGASPEMLLRCEHGNLVTHPIAGTRKRGLTDKEDKAAEEELLKNVKERAEHVMLVDLARNDLGKVGQKGKVIVSRFMTVERFSHVMHIVSEVQARLAKGQTIFSAFTGCFPAGTLSGAPKVRAMQIINDIEPDIRGIYGGSVGYFSFTNSLDTCIIIRTIIFKDDKAYVQAGAGIVYDSCPEAEFVETVNKAKAQILALRMAAGDKQMCENGKQ